MSEAMTDVGLASWLSLAGQMLLMILFFRSLKRTLVQGVVLVIGLCWTFGIAALVVGHLNLLSIVFGPLLLGQFVRDLRAVDPDVIGDPVLLYVFTLAFRNACLWAAGASLLGIALLVAFLLRSLWLTILALIPLMVGTALALSLMWLLEVPFNQANVLFLPLILGEAVEYGIIILVRWQKEKSARVITLPAGTAKGVLLAALTTAVGFGSLMISGHQGTFSLGLLSAVGSLSVLLAALSVLPALLRLLRERFPGA